MDKRCKGEKRSVYRASRSFVCKSHKAPIADEKTIMMTIPNYSLR